MKGILLLPVYNDFSKLLDLISSISMDLVIIDDGSKSDIKLILDGLKCYKHYKLIHYKVNKGKGYALRKGFDYAIKNKYDYVIMMDSDGEHDPSDIPRFIEMINIYDFVIGERQIFRSLKRKILNFIGGISFRLLIPGIKDTQSGFRAIKTKLLRKMNLSSQKFEIETEMLLEAFKSNALIGMMPIQSKPIHFSNVGLQDYLKINDYFDEWIILNISQLKINFIKKAALFLLVMVGIISSYLSRVVLRWIQR